MLKLIPKLVSDISLLKNYVRFYTPNNTAGELCWYYLQSIKKYFGNVQSIKKYFGNVQ